MNTTVDHPYVLRVSCTILAHHVILDVLPVLQALAQNHDLGAMMFMKEMKIQRLSRQELKSPPVHPGRCGSRSLREVLI